MDTTNFSLEATDNCVSDKPDANVGKSKKRKIKAKTAVVKYETFDASDNGYEVIIEGPGSLLEAVGSKDLSIEHDNDSEQSRRGRRKSSTQKRESSEDRHMRLARMSAYAAQRLANESPEARALRLKRMSEYAARRLSSESPEARAVRLQRMSAYAARRIASETPEQRAARLARMSAYAAKRHALRKAQCEEKSE